MINSWQRVNSDTLKYLLSDLIPGNIILSCHTIIPAFITKEREPWVSFGIMDGSMQLQGQAVGY
ncbi:MAG: hypothetical protein IMY71_11185 [Bacteroidetes bacterium]|nr:hypothetical protein [Bacteroidota bacterium]